MVEKPTEEERLNFVRSYGVEPVDVNTDLTFKDAATTVAEMTPIIGDAMAAKEIYDELQKEDPDYRFIALLGGAGLIGAIPGIGDVAAKGIRNAADMIKRIEVDPDALGSLGGNIRLKPKETGRGLVRDVDDLVDTWAKGDISNKELRDSAKELGVEINTKRITKNRDSSDIEITMPDGNIYTGVNTIPDEVVDPEYVKGLTKPAETDALQELGLTDEALEAWKKENYAKDQFRVKRLEKLEDAAKALREGEITSGEFRELADAYMPIVPIKEMPNFPTKEEVVKALHATAKKKVEKGIIGVNKTIKDGTPISARLDIPAYNDTDTWVVSLHDGTTKNGDTVGYAQTAVLNDVNFTTNPLAASAIAAGNVKTTIARMNGSYVNADPEEVYNTAKQLLEANPEDWTQVGMNPFRASYFYDKADGMPVTSADQVIQVGPLVFANNVKKTTPDDEMFQFTNKRTGVTANFSEGGMALEEQMSMNFGDVPDNTIGQDPVSGNEIPLGATAENVRDDIPANLSEGEIVVAADVVNFHGVKLFEDLRKEAKMGYAQMAEDGRIGGEPMDMNDDMDIELSELDLEIMDDEAPIEMRRGGMSMKDYEGVTKNRDIKPPKRSGPRKTHEQIMAQFRDNDSSSSSSKPTSFAQSLSERVQARKDKPKNRFEALRNRLRDIFDDDDEPKRQSRFDFGFSGNPMERAARKYGSPASATKNESLRAGQVAGAYRGGEEPKNTSVRYYEQPFYKRLMEGIGFDEGGLVEDDEQQHLIGGESQFNEGPFYAQKGGFDMENAYANYGEGTGGPVLEMREYMNDDGHRIFITFIDGEPQMEIPAGYYPVGDSEVVAPTAPTPPVGGSGGSDMGDSGSGTDMPTPEAVNFKELSMEELTQLIEDQKSLSSKIVKNINPLVRIAMWDQTRRTKAEIERRLADPNTSNVDKMRLRQLLELANRDEPGLIKSLLDKVTGSTLETAAGQIPKPKVPDVDFDDPTESGTNVYRGGYDNEPNAYTPSEQDESGTTTPGVPSYDPIPPAGSGFPAKPDPAEEFGGSQTRFQQPTVVPKERRVSTPDPTPVNEMSPRVKAARQNTQKVLKDMRDRGASREDRTASMAAGARTEQVLRDLDRGVVRGFKEGGLVDKPKVKKVVKGLKKASKSHAKQAATLEDALKASKKKKSK